MTVVGGVEEAKEERLICIVRMILIIYATGATPTVICRGNKDIMQNFVIIKQYVSSGILIVFWIVNISKY